MLVIEQNIKRDRDYIILSNLINMTALINKRMKLPMTTYAILILILGASTTSCSNINNKPINTEKRQESKKTLTGNWVIKNIETIKEINYSQKLENTSFFGISTWKDSKGKFINITTDSLTTNIVELNDNPATFLFSIEEDRITFRMSNPKSPTKEIIDVFHAQLVLDDNTLELFLDNAIKVTLKRQ